LAAANPAHAKQTWLMTEHEAWNHTWAPSGTICI
jgi:hypothetical protein